MAIGQGDLVRLADLIDKNIKEEFALKHLSGNLSKSIKIIKVSDTEVDIQIAPMKYDVYAYEKTGVIKPYEKGKTPMSYAQSVDKTGGFSGEHTNFVMRAIRKALITWKEELSRRGFKAREEKI